MKHKKSVQTYKDELATLLARKAELEKDIPVCDQMKRDLKKQISDKEEEIRKQTKSLREELSKFKRDHRKTSTLLSDKEWELRKVPTKQRYIEKKIVDKQREPIAQSNEAEDVNFSGHEELKSEV